MSGQPLGRAGVVGELLAQLVSRHGDPGDELLRLGFGRAHLERLGGEIDADEKRPGEAVTILGRGGAVAELVPQPIDPRHPPRSGGGGGDVH